MSNMAKTDTVSNPDAVPDDAQEAQEESLAEPHDSSAGGLVKWNQPPGVVIKAGEEPSVAASSDGVNFVVVQEDVWQEFYSPGTTRPSYSLIVGKGTVLSEAELNAKGVKMKTEPTGTEVHEFGAGAVGQTDALNAAIDGRAEKAAKKASKRS